MATSQASRLNERWGVLRSNEAFASIEEQLALLRERGLTIRDESRASHALSVIGYHRLRDYFRPFYLDVEAPSKERRFAEGTSFNSVISLYYLDRELRFFLLGPLEKLEVALRGRIIDHVGNTARQKDTATGHSFNILDPEFYNLSNEDNREDYARLVGAVMQAIGLLANPEQKEELKRLKDKRPKLEPHEVVEWIAPWPVVHKLSFGPLAILYRIFKPEIAIPIAREFSLTAPILRKILDALRIVRNSCAHHEPVWFRQFQHIPLPNSISKSVWPPDAEEGSWAIESGGARVYEVCVILHYLMSQVSENTTWYKRLSNFIERFDTDAREFMGFPTDWNDLNFWRNPMPVQKNEPIKVHPQ